MNNKFELYHYGIPNQKWGDRRFQYEDGTYTEEGKLRKRGYKPLKGKMSSKKRKEMANRAFIEQVKQGKDKPSTTRAALIAKSGSDIVSKTSNIVKRYYKENDTNLDLNKYSDAELRNYINRMELEQRYANLSNSNIKSGKEKVLDVLDTIGDISAIGMSAIAILSMYKQIKG